MARENLHLIAQGQLIDEGLRPSSLRKSPSQSTDEVVGYWQEAVRKRMQEIRDSRDILKQRDKQLATRKEGFGKARKALEDATGENYPFLDNAETFWGNDPVNSPLQKRQLTDKTGKKINIPLLDQVDTYEREVDTADGGRVRQAVGPYGFVSNKLSPEGKKQIDDYRAAKAEQAEKFKRGLADNRHNAAIRRLEEAGVDTYPIDEKGNLDIGEAKRMADLAAGRRVQATFDSWDYDKYLDQQAKLMERDARRELSDLKRARRNRYGGSNPRVAEPLTAERAARMRELEGQLMQGEMNRDGLRPGYWREQAEDADRNAKAQRVHADRIADMQRTEESVLRLKAEAIRPETEVTPGMLEALGYAPFEDVDAWEKLVKNDSFARMLWEKRPKKVSSTSAAMNRAASLYT